MLLLQRETRGASSPTSCQAVIPEMLKTGERGTIINIASVAGLAGWMFSEASCTAKFGHVGLTRSRCESDSQSTVIEGGGMI